MRDIRVASHDSRLASDCLTVLTGAISMIAPSKILKTGRHGYDIAEHRNRPPRPNALGYACLSVLREQKGSARYCDSVFQSRVGKQGTLHVGDFRTSNRG